MSSTAIAQTPSGVAVLEPARTAPAAAAAALPKLLGVPKESMVADCLRTGDCTLPKFQRAIDPFVAGGGERSIAPAVLGVMPEYLEDSFDEVARTYGTIGNCFDEALGIDAAEQRALRERFIAGR